MKMKSILTELLSFKLSYFGQLSCTVEYGAFLYEVCVINFFHSFQWIIFKLYIHGHVGAIL